MATDRYFLSPSVHWCATGGHCIILDIATDQYLQVPAGDFNSLLPFVGFDSSTDPRLTDAEIPAELTGFARGLLAARVLSRTPSQIGWRPPPTLPRPTELVSTATHHMPVMKIARMLPRFLMACAAADYHLRHTSLSRICARVSARKRQCTPGTYGDSRERAIQLTHGFNTLRPFYPRHYLCLFDSLALIEFLAHWHILPNWVFGVSVDPFEAHCWLQDGEVVLSDTVTFSSRWYTTIMVI